MTRDFKQPTTRLEDLFEYKKAVKGELNLALARKEAGIDPDSVELHLKARVDALYEQYKAELNLDDFYFFKTLEELERFLGAAGCFDQDLIRRTIAHENAHRAKAQELGYEVKGFGCFLALDEENKIRYHASTHFKNGHLMAREDFRAIALAPDDPSFTDLYG